MREATGIEQIRGFVRETKEAGRLVGFVPTMGSLHEGHLSLVRLAQERQAAVVLSIFVNPTQFAPGEDFESYPRDLSRDRALAETAGVDFLFVPSVREMYPPGFQTKVSVPGLAAPLCGRGRPGHFDGVALIVAKLLNILRPDFSVFGRKDAQQAILIRRMARDLHLPGEIVLGPTVREADGLAMSSRNAYLRPEERRAATAISRGLFHAKKAYDGGERDGVKLVKLVREEVDQEALLAVEYVEIVDREEL
ncbi:MAG TPA: pantoate--beta-alanine ligase, partial [bacterium]|nr:pantoate--beta-alanine ligase [bacterium]